MKVDKYYYINVIYIILLLNVGCYLLFIIYCYKEGCFLKVNINGLFGWDFGVGLLMGDLYVLVIGDGVGYR